MAHESIYVRLFSSILRGCAFGILGGLIFGIIGDSVYWIFTRYSYQPLYDSESVIALVIGGVLIIALPIGFVIGAITGIHSGIFTNYCQNPIVMTILSSLGVVSGLWLSGYSANTNNIYFFYLDIVIISLGTSWLVNKYGIQEYKIDKHISNPSYSGICSISIALFIFICIYSYFNFCLYLLNIPS